MYLQDFGGLTSNRNPKQVIIHLAKYSLKGKSEVKHAKYHEWQKYLIPKAKIYPF